MSQTMPVSIQLIQDANTGMLFCSELSIIYGLHGSVLVTVGSNQFNLGTGGLLAINPFTHYKIFCENSEAVLLQISQDVLRLTGILQDAQISCFIADDSSGVHSQYDYLRMYFARIFKAYFRSSDRNTSQIITPVSQLLSVLSEHFSVPAENNIRTKDLKSVYQRYDRILKFIHEKWREQISIEQIAQQEFLSVGYLSRLFKKYVGQTFTEYLTELRLQGAAHELEQSDKTVTEIAYANGFRSANSFIEHFKARYGDTPKQYRLKAQQNRLSAKLTASEDLTQDSIETLLHYAELEALTTSSDFLPTEERAANISADVKGTALRHTWRRLVNIGYARDGLLAVVQNQLRQAQQEIGFEFLRFHGILDDDMHVYHESENHEPFLDFSRVDLLLDFVLSIGLKPFIELGFVPKLLARGEKQVYDRPSFVSLYRDEQKWRFLINGLIQHCVDRYGRDQVLHWKFTTMGITIVTTGIIGQADYLKIYHTTYDSVKSVDRRFQFGGPGGIASSILDGHSIHEFFEYVIKHECPPDFICTQVYPHHSIEQDSEFMHLTISQRSAPAILSGNERYTQSILADYRKLLQQFGLSHLGIWIEEWNSTLWQRDLSNDTCYKSAWLAKNLCENYDSAESFGYWLLSDFIEERSAFGNVFHGGYGLFTYNNIPKSGWHALRLMRMLGDTLLASGDGWIATKDRSGIQIVLTHYCHYDTLYRLRYQRLTDPKQAYSVFVEKGGLHYSIQLDGLSPGRYEIQQYSISREHGSSYDAWLEIGEPRYLRPSETDYLTTASQPQYHVEVRELQSRYLLERTLEPHEVQVILLKNIEYK